MFAEYFNHSIAESSQFSVHSTVTRQQLYDPENYRRIRQGQ